MPADPVSPSRALPMDTTPQAAARQIEIWRSLSTIEITQLVAGASHAARTLALAGLRDRYPAASEHELIVRLAAITLGVDLARRVYPELDQMAP